MPLRYLLSLETVVPNCIIPAKFDNMIIFCFGGKFNYRQNPEDSSKVGDVWNHTDSPDVSLADLIKLMASGSLRSGLSKSATTTGCR